MKPTRIRSIAPADKEDRGGRSGLLPTVDPNRMFGMVPELNHPVCLASLLSCDWQVFEHSSERLGLDDMLQDALTPTTSSTSRSSQTPPPPDSTSTEFTSKSTGSSSVLTNPTVDGGEDIAEPEMLCPSLQPLGILGLDSRYDWLCGTSRLLEDMARFPRSRVLSASHLGPGSNTVSSSVEEGSDLRKGTERKRGCTQTFVLCGRVWI